MTDAERERAAVVAWLRDEMSAQRRLSGDQRLSNLDRHVYEVRSNFLDMLADAIGQGAHLKDDRP